MANTSVVYARIDTDLKENAENIVSISPQHLRDMLTTSDRDLSEFVERINILEEANAIFNSSDLLDEFSYIQENTNLEASYLNNIKNYIEIVTNPSVNGSDITE